MRDVTLSKEIELRGYANRDSLGYREGYRIPEVKTLLRGTLRYPGFGKVIGAAKTMGLLSQQKFDSQPANWSQLISLLSGIETAALASDLPMEDSVKESFAWLGCFSDEVVEGDSPISAFCNLLCAKLQYADDEQDMIVMQHRMVLVDKQGQKTFHRSTLIEKGDLGGFSAMAKTVGYPAAIAADLILQGKIERKGVCIPVTKDIYEPVLNELEKLNIRMEDKIIKDQSETSFLNEL